MYSDLDDAFSAFGSVSTDTWIKSDKYTDYPIYHDEQYAYIEGRTIGDINSQVSVQGESYSQYISFMMDRYYDGVDITTKSIWIHYELVDGSGSESSPINVYYNDNSVRFGWIIPDQATQQAGDIKIGVWVTGTAPNTKNYLLKTETKIYTIKNGLVLGSGITQPDQNWFEQFVSQMDNKVSTAQGYANDAQASKTAAAGSATAAAQSADASAKALQENKDYVESQKETFVGYNKRETDLKYANALIGSASGTGRVTVEDAWEAPIPDLEVAGKSDQFTTTGAQLFDASLIPALTAGGVTVEGTADGGYHISGSGDSGTFYKTVKITDLTMLKAGNIMLKSESSVPKFSVRLMDSSSTILFELTADQTRTITEEMLSTEGVYLQYMFYGAVSNVTPGTYYPMLYQDGDGTWEPYTGGKPSPSPEYPQEVIGTGTVTMGMQLLPDSALSTGYLTSADGKKDPNSIYRTIWINLLAGTYTFSVSGGAMIVKTVIDGVFGNNNTAIVDGSGYTCILASDGYLGISFRKLDSTEYTTEPQVMLNIGTRTNPWEPYTGGKPSPSSEYPQPLAITVTGAQLINPDSRNASRAICTVINDKIKIVAVDDTGWQNIHFRIGPAEKYAGKKLYLHITNMSGGTDTARAMLVWTKDNIGAVTSFFTYGKSQFGTWKEIDIPSSIPDSADTLSLYLCITEYKNDNSYPVIGTEAVFERVILSESKVDWRPYQSNTATIQLTSPLYAVEDHKDEITMTKRINRCVELEFNGSEDWGLYDSTVYKGFWLYNALPEKMNRREGFCNQLKIDTIGRKTENGLWLGPNSGNKAIYAINSQFFDDTAADKGLAAWKAHLASHPLKIVTYLDTPVETDLPAATQTALNALTTFTGTTHITITAGGPEPDVAVEYVQDTNVIIAGLKRLIEGLINA